MPKPSSSDSNAKPRRRDRFRDYFGSKSKQDAPPITPEPPSIGPSTPRVTPPPSTLTTTSLPGDSHTSSAVPPVSSDPINPPQNVSLKQAKLNPTIFPENISRTVKIQLPGYRIESTAQLAHCAHLLNIMDSPSFSASLPPSPESLKAIDGLSLRMEDLEWMRFVDQDKVVEKNRIQQLVVSTVKEFIEDPLKDLNAIREIVLLGPVLGKEHFRRLLAELLSKFDKAPIFEVEILPGIVQLVQDAPSGCLEVDDLFKILDIIRIRLEKTSSQTDDFLFPLAVAVSGVLSIMADMEIKDMNRVKQHDPLRTALAGLKSDRNPFLRYQAIYAAQALWRVPDDETPVKCFLRHFTDVTGALIKLSAVMQLDINGFAGGAKDIQKSVQDMYKFVKSGIEDIPAMKEGSKELCDYLRAMIGGGRTHPWYMSIRGAEDLIRTGRLADLREWACMAPSHGSYLFQWGICQLLGEIAVDPSWDKDTRGQAILFLGEMSKKSTHANVRKWIITILDNISRPSKPDPVVEAVQSMAIAARDDLQANGDEAYSFPYHLGRRMPLPSVYLILRKVNKIAELEPALSKIKRRIVERGPVLYIPLKSRAGRQDSGDTLVWLEDRISRFLESNRQIMLILGDSGAGKSTFNRHLEYSLWSEYGPGDRIPLLIDLKTTGNLAENDVIRKKLTPEGFNDDQIQELKEYRKMLLICDGYDECRQLVNLHNRLKDEGWKSFQIVVTCRTQYLAPNYREFFVPRLEVNQTPTQASALYEEAVIVPFVKNQIEDYINLFRETEEVKEAFKGRTIWSTEEYMSRLANLLELVKNPFMLHLALITIPKIPRDDQGTPQVKMTRFHLYEEFANQHFENERSRLSNQQTEMKVNDEQAFTWLVEEGFVCHGIYFSMRLAHSVFVEQAGKNYIEYSAAKDNRGWKYRFFDSRAKDDIRLLRQSSQVVTTIQEPNNRGTLGRAAPHKTVHSFSHQSILEFFYACRLCDYIPNPSSDKDSSESTPYSDLESCLSPNVDSCLLVDHPLNQRSIVSEWPVVHFLAEHATTNTKFKEQLQSIIVLSKNKENKVAVAAANAITILVMAGEQFNGTDLRDIQIPGADLSGGHFDSALFNGANLTGVNLSRAWLRQVDFCGANMSGVQFGVKPSVKFPGLTAMALSPSGADLALGFESGEVRVLDTADWRTRGTLQSHTYRVSHLAFSSSGRQIASGSRDTTIRIWDWQQKSPRTRILKGHRSEVNGVAFSPDSRLLCSVSDDMSVRIWDMELDSVIYALDGHEDEAWCTAWSRDGQQVASGGKDGAVYLWQAAYGEFERQLWRETESVCSLAYAPDSNRLVAAVGKDILLWDLQTGGEPVVLAGHTSSVRAVSFSRNEEWIVSAGLDETVGIWNGRTGAPVRKLHGSDSGGIIAVAFLSDQEIVSLDYGGTLRFWELSRGTARADVLGIVAGPMSEGHRDFVETVAYSRDGKKFLSGGRDNCIREWDAKTGESRVVTTTQANILCIALSPDNRQIALATLDEVPILLEQVEDSDEISPKGHLGDYSVVIITYSPCGRWIVSGAANGVLTLLDRSDTEAKEQLLMEHTCCISGIEFSPDGEIFISWSNWRTDPTVRVWKSESGDLIDIIDLFMESLTFSPCGTMFAWSAAVETDENGQNMSEILPDIHLADLQDWKRDIHLLEGHKDVVYSIAWTSEWIVSGSSDRTVRLWKEHRDSETGFGSWSCVATLYDIAIYSLAWNPVPSSLEFVTGCQDSSVCVWTVVQNDRQGEGDGNGDSWQATIHLKWGSIDRLETRGARITGAEGLDATQKELLRQHGSIGDAASDVEDVNEEEEEALVRRFRVTEVADVPSSKKPERYEEVEEEEEEETLIRRFRR